MIVSWITREQKQRSRSGFRHCIAQTGTRNDIWKKFSDLSEVCSQANLCKIGLLKIEEIMHFWFQRVDLMHKSLLYNSTQTKDFSWAKSVKTVFLARKACFFARWTFPGDCYKKNFILLHCQKGFILGCFGPISPWITIQFTTWDLILNADNHK